MKDIAQHLWQTEAIRASCITKLPVEPGAEELWKEIFGLPPEETASRSSQTLRTANGSIGNGRLEMRVRFNRIDWIMTPEEPPIGKIPSLGPAKEAHLFLTEAILRWLKSGTTPSVVRLAFCPAYFITTESVEESSNMLQDFLAQPSKIFESAQDILVRRNYQTKLRTLPETSLNRISTISTVAVQIISASQDSTTPSFEDRSLLKIEIDINTAANRAQEIPEDKIAPTFSELIAVASEILENGHHP